MDPSTPVPQPAYVPVPQAEFMAPPPPQKRSKALLIWVIILALLTIGAGGFAVWAYMSYLEQKSDVDAKIAQATSKAVKLQKETDEKAYNEALKYPYWKFDGPADLGALSFYYPKTWDVYVDKDGRDGKTYEAYLDKGTIPPVSDDQQFGLRVTITEEAYDKVVDDYDDLVKDGDLKSQPVSVSGKDGVRLDGNFNKNKRGSAVIFKIRDKTLILQTDISTGEVKDEFETLIKTVTFNT